MSGIYNIGLQSLMAYEAAMNVVSQNIANVNTPYYSRRQVDFVEQLFQGGVSIGDVNRIYSDSLSQNMQMANSNYEQMNTLLTQLKSFEPMLDDDKNSIATYINNAMASLKQLDADTSSVQQRSAYLQQLTILINQFGTVNGQINTQLANANQSMESYAQDSNTIMKSIANLNQQIANAPTGSDTSELLDQREQQVQQLAKYFNFTTQTDSQGQLSISLSNGMQVVNGGTAYAFTTVPDAQNPADLDLALSNGSINIPVGAFISSGQVQGTITFRQTLEQSQRAIGQLSLAYSQTMNAQNKLGIDYNGNAGGNIFNDINNSTIITDRSVANLNNHGSSDMTVNIDDVTKLTTSNYNLKFDTAGHYILTRISDGTVVNSGNVSSTMPQTISADGFSINLSSVSAQAGDQYLISPTREATTNMGLAITDPKLLALAWPVTADPSTQNTGTGAVQLEGITDTTTGAFSTPHQLSPPVTIKFLSATSYELINATDNSVMEGPITYDPANGAKVFPTPGGYDPGYRVSLSGNINAGDTFSLSFNTNSMGDNRNGLMMENLYSQGVLQGGSLSFIQGYRLLASDVSIQTSATDSAYTSTQTIKQQAEAQFDQLSGVSLQEETVNLASYQQAYQASAQILQTAKSVFDQVMRILEG